jgi:glycosyltransferase involved in cell wall biosynthesis
MPQPGGSSANSALFLTPEPPVLGTGGGALRSASLLAYLRTRYTVEMASFTLPHHSKATIARAWRNSWRLLRGTPPLLDRFSGFEAQLDPVLRGRHYQLGVIEHFWCAPYAATLRPHCDRLVLDLHNIESELARSHAMATRGAQSAAFSRFADAYQRSEREWLPKFDIVLVASQEDRDRVDHPNVHIYPNALPEIPRPEVAEADCIIFSGNLEYHPNTEGVRWFNSQVWPIVRARCPGIEWRVVGRNPHAVERFLDSAVLIGPVDDAVKTLAEAKVCVAPLLSGSGTRFKILEAWAAARAVVSTTIGAEGLGARPGEHLLVADEPSAFADAVVRLLENPDLRRRMGDAGRELYLDRYTWQAAWKKLEILGR